MPQGDGGLGPQLAGERIHVNHRVVAVVKQLGEGGFSFVYLVKDTSDGGATTPNSSLQTNPSDASTTTNGSGGSSGRGSQQNQQMMVLKITSIHSRQQRDIAEKEAKLLSRLSHPSIVKMVDACYRSTIHTHSGGLVAGIVGGSKGGGGGGGDHGSGSSQGASPTGARPQHMILMEYCEGGHALDVCNRMATSNRRFDLPSLIIAFGQICNAVSYLHAQRPPIVHRDLKPVNFLVKNGAYKLCDFGSAVFGHVELKTAKQRSEAEEVIERTTTQMFRAPEMVDLYVAKKLTQSTDVWALGCCLYSLAFFQNCFEEGSNLAILSRKYKIPENNPYGDGLVELIDRMLTTDAKARADMTEVILCLSAIYSGRPLPPRKKVKSKKKDAAHSSSAKDEKRGTYRTDGQGIHSTPKVEPKKTAEAKKLNPKSVAARRAKAAIKSGADSPTPKGEGGSNLPPVPLSSDPPMSGGGFKQPSAARPNHRQFEDSFSDLFAFKGKSHHHGHGGDGGGGGGGSNHDDSGFATSDNPFSTNAAAGGKSFESEVGVESGGIDRGFFTFEEEPGEGAKSPVSAKNDGGAAAFGSGEDSATFPAFETDIGVGNGADGFGDAAFPSSFDQKQEGAKSSADDKAPDAAGVRGALEGSGGGGGSASRSSSVERSSNEFESLNIGDSSSAQQTDGDEKPRHRRRKSGGNALTNILTGGKSKGSGGDKSPDDGEPKKKGGIKGILSRSGSYRKGKIEV